MLVPEYAAYFLESLVFRLDEMELEEEIDSASRQKMLKQTRRNWDFGVEYRLQDSPEPYCPGHPLVKRTFNFFTKITTVKSVLTSMKAALLNTLLLLALVHPLDYASEQLRVILDSITFQAQTSNTEAAWKQTVMQLINLDPSERLIALGFFVSQFSAYMASASAAIDSSLIGPGWLYLWLQQEVLGGNGQAVLDGILTSLEHIATDKSVLITPTQELQVMCLLFMLRRIASLVVMNEENLLKAEYLIEGFDPWVYPVGYYASETKLDIQRERKAPGCALRRRCVESDARLGLLQPSRRLAPSVYVIMNPHCARSCNLTCLLNCQEEGDGDVQSQVDAEYLNYTRWRLILQMLRNSGVEHVVSESQAHGPAIFSEQPEEFTATIYERLLIVMAEAEQISDVQEGANCRMSKVSEIWNDLRQQFQLENQLQPEVAVDPAFIEDLPTNRLNPLRFVRVNDGEPSWTPNTGEVTDLQGGVPRFSRTGSEGILFDIIQKSLDLSNYGYREVVKVMVGGGDGTLHYLLAGYVNLFYFGDLLATGVMDEFDLRFYLLPTGKKSSLATYLAQLDLWYDASIYRVINSPLPLVPHVGNPEDGAQENASGTKQLPKTATQSLGPSVIITRQVENYALEGNCVMEINVFNCEAWYHDGNAEVYCTIPFYARAEIGITVAMAATFGERQLGQHVGKPRPPQPPPEGTTLESLAQQVSLRLALRWVPVDLEGNAVPEDMKSGSYLSILVINVPRPHEHRLCCKPGSRNLDVCVLDDTEISKTQTKSLEDIIFQAWSSRVNILIVEAIRELAEDGKLTTQHFDILLDGEVYGPFHRVTFSPCNHPNIPNQSIKIPVATCWPTECSRG